MIRSIRNGGQAGNFTRLHPTRDRSTDATSYAATQWETNYEITILSDFPRRHNRAKPCGRLIAIRGRKIAVHCIRYLRLSIQRVMTFSNPSIIVRLPVLNFSVRRGRIRFDFSRYFFLFFSFSTLFSIKLP